MKCKGCGVEMSGEMVGEGFAPEGKLPLERKKYTCKNEKCSRFNDSIRGRTLQEAMELAQARFVKDYPKAGVVVDGSYATWFNHDTWIIEIEHMYRNDPDKESGTIYTFGYAIRDDQREEEAETAVRKGLIESRRWEQPFRRT